MTQLFRTFLIFLCLLTNIAAFAIEPAQPAPTKTETIQTAFPEGKKLHDAHCVKCHQSMTFEKPDDIYSRPERIIKQYDSLKTQVQRCVTNTDLMWFEEEVDNVSHYLNEQYYHFEIKE
ncbi:hypothetical protein [Beggiatoa leptomitoformis]|uniref:Cytochrome c n=1 Tax=Beggiatoa leptomitoformis TaxID=288004 RepID=A0A2N9YJD3_9GAMM|nr:hypothetical protein [Beggiatoa leptomitoformis]ALG69503.2 hypothetical protein AL038_13790 [Beggiatoa leptomitoformis]AUI70594.2 hypothetical protein BLE401_10470 [Beggiatoa leptomitoformis]